MNDLRTGKMWRGLQEAGEDASLALSFCFLAHARLKNWIKYRALADRQRSPLKAKSI
jgi:hypothetical protein